MDHVFNMRITVVRWDGFYSVEAPRGQLVAYTALASWQATSRKMRTGRRLPEEMRWCEASVHTGWPLGRGHNGARGSVRRADLGVTWCRGWEGPDVAALLAAAALAA